LTINTPGQVGLITVDRCGITRGPARMLAWLLGSALAVLGTGHSFSAPHHKQALEAQHHKKGSSAAEVKRNTAAHEPSRASAIPLPRSRPAFANEVPVLLPPDAAATRQSIDLVRQNKLDEAGKLAATIDNPAAQKLVEWALLRQPESTAGFDRYAAFIHANPEWPSIPLLRRRAEATLWQERRDAATVHGFLDGEPTSPAGRLALGRVLQSEGNRVGAKREVQSVWRSAEMSADLEVSVLDVFRDMLSPADHLVRMDRRIGAKDFAGAMRAAKRLGSDQVAVVKACSAAKTNSENSAALLGDVPGQARDLGYALCRLHWLMRTDHVAAAAQLVLAASQEDLRSQDTDEWWRELRALARRLVDLGDAKTAYEVVRKAAVPANSYYRAEFHFMPGWIALRFLADPATALSHFAHIDEGSDDPIVRARAAYWRGRAAEAMGQLNDMRAQYQAAAQYPTAYYGQLARARIGLSQVGLRPPPVGPPTSSGQELVRAAELLYEMSERDLALSFVSDLAETSSDITALLALGQLAADHDDARAMLLIGKTALARGFAMDYYAFPDIGVPAYTPVGPPLDRSIVYSVVRTESAFNPQDLSPAKAVGLMQVTPEAGRDTAKRFGATFDWQRMVTDPVYNTQMGAAELAGLFKEYHGSYIMTFAAYNAGRGRVKEWVGQHGDPRDPKIDAVDWIERIPLAETRNYVQRVLENLQIYRARFGAGIVTLEPNLHRPAAVNLDVAPASLEEASHAN
jgi:soluble lytic murein transglycosylase